MTRTNPATFARLYEVTKTDTQKISFKGDRSVLRMLIIFYEAVRNVNLVDILKHELLLVPLFLAETVGSLRTGQKSILLDELCKKGNCIDNYSLPEDFTLDLDGQALVALGKPQRHMCAMFREFSKVFVNAVL